MHEDLIHLGLSEEKADWVCAQWKGNLVAMSRVAAGQTLTVNQLVDMEWRFGGTCSVLITISMELVALSLSPAVTATNSDMKKVGNTFLQLKLVLDKGTGTEDVFMGESFPSSFPTPDPPPLQNSLYHSFILSSTKWKKLRRVWNI